MEDLGALLADGAFIVLDGAMGTALMRRGVPLDGPVWSASALLTHPGAVRDLHENYVRAGAQVHIANTFSSARHVLKHVGLDARTREINERAVRLAREAIERCAPAFPTWVAGSISTFAAYSARERVARAELRASFAEQADLLAGAGCDLLALEMMLTHENAIDLEFTPEIVEVAAATGLAVWLGYSCKISDDGETLYLYDGDEPVNGSTAGRRDDARRFRDALRAALAGPIAAAGPMLSDMSATGPAVVALKRDWDGPIVAYPNSGHALHRDWRHDDFTEPEAFARAAEGWMRIGAQVVGGCCGIGPEHIAALHRRLAPRGNPKHSWTARSHPPRSMKVLRSTAQQPYDADRRRPRRSGTSRVQGEVATGP